MRAALFGLVVAGILFGVWWLLQAGGDAGRPGPAAAAPDPVVVAPGAGIARAVDTGAARSPLPAPASTAMRSPVDLADHATAFLQVLDASSKAPVTGAGIYRFHRAADESAIAYSDGDGRVGLPLSKPEQLVVAMPAYLLRLAPTRLDSTAEAPQTVYLEPDRYSLRCGFRFVQPDGGVPREVRVLLRPQQDGAAARRPSVHGESEAARRAWEEHCTIGSLMALPEIHVQVGKHNAEVVHVLAGEDEVRFVEDGTYELEAATVDEFVARTVLASGAMAGRVMVVPLQPGRAIDGVVRSGGGGPVALAQVTVLDGEPLRLVAHTDAMGRFRIGPLADGPVVLEVRHRDHEPARTEPIEAGSTGVTVTLAELPADTLRGRVRAQPHLLPLAGATVSMLDSMGQAVTTTTAADGTFALGVSRKEAARVNIAAPGFMTWSELVEPRAPALDYDLWPGDTAARLRDRITGVVAGVVVDDHGRPVAGIVVRLQPDRPKAAPALSGRRILAGGAVIMPSTATTASDGAFELETECAGPGALFPLDGSASPGPGVRVEVELGATKAGVRLTARR